MLSLCIPGGHVAANARSFFVYCTRADKRLSRAARRRRVICQAVLFPFPQAVWYQYTSLRCTSLPYFAVFLAHRDKVAFSDALPLEAHVGASLNDPPVTPVRPTMHKHSFQ